MIQARQPNAEDIRDCMPWSLINILLGGVLLGIIGVLLSYETQNRKNEGDVQSAKKWSRITLIFNVFTDLVFIGITIAVVVAYTTKNQNIY
jgi:heme/copper-type cytochrome/quinol oxidase subunit 2